MYITRHLEEHIRSDLQQKIVILGGPRQVGKATLAKGFTSGPQQYLNWDALSDRELIKKHQIDPELGIIVLDEIHKYRQWRGLIKGFHDKYKESLKILVTGSARIDHFRKGGDSLFGRCFYYRLHPLSLKEIAGLVSSPLENLLKFGGFPEPLLKASEDFHRRWARERLQRVVYQDVRDLNNLRDIGLMELLVDALPTRVGSALSIKNLAQDLEVSPNTISGWIRILESVYYCYCLNPFGPPKIRAVKKAKKLYLWDWSAIPSPGARFENLVAGQLLKYCHLEEDTLGYAMELRWLKDVDNREIDFIVLRDKAPLFAVECKQGDREVSKNIRYFQKRVPIPHFYQVHLGIKAYREGNIHILPFERFCKKLSLP